MGQEKRKINSEYWAAGGKTSDSTLIPSVAGDGKFKRGGLVKTSTRGVKES